MARIKGDLIRLLEAAGRLGDFDIKKRGDTWYLATRASFYNPSMKPEPVMYRGKFSVNGKFAGPLNKNKYLFEVWKKSRIKASVPINRITKTNFELCLQDRPSADNVISPPGGFPLKLTALNNAEDKVKIEIQPFRLRKNEIKVICLLYICHYAPLKPDYKYYQLMEIKESVVEKSAAEFIFNVNDKTFAERYGKQIYFFCLLTMDRNNNIIRHSETAGADLGEIGEEMFVKIGLHSGMDD